ncbi:cullin-4A [Brachionus plicatilis]|uniref:Cullin-4 n=1 Tax=Brachionus plicatilis TaxID=10195 RepID=A0A3M7T0V2_BRAPC|nr:cullin-4A [Brachionus plicatilis]
MMSTKASEQAAKKLGIMMTSRSSANGQTAKRLVIKNLKMVPRNDEDNFSRLWKNIDEAVRAIHESRPVSMSLEMLYQKINDPIDYLKLLNRHWQDHCAHMVMICQIFLPLDRGYVLNNPLILSIWDLGLDLFKNHIVMNKLVQTRCISGLLALIDSERGGELIDRSLVKNLLTMLYKLQLYQSIFESEFIKASDKLYSNEGETMLQSSDIPEYLKHVEKRLNEENNRLLHYLHPSTKHLLILCVEKNLIGDHVNTILQKGFDNLMDDHRLDDLKLLYNLLSRFVNGIDQLKTYFSQYIKKRGRDIVINPEKDVVMIQELLDFKERLDAISECWNNNEKFTHALKDSFEHFINQRSNKPAELIAKYIDNKLKAGNKEATEEELDKILDKIMVLFRFIHGKDVFEAFYKKDLAKRLLLGKSASVDAEKSMLSKLKQECGGVFTFKLEGMFKDMELSKDIMSAFDQQLTVKTSINLFVNVLTLTHWPSYPIYNIILPPEMTQLQERFLEFYKKKYSGRNLQWQPSLGHCLVKGHISSGNNKEFHVSLYQALILLLFNNKDEVPYEEILESTKIEESELKRTLQSLACGKVSILIKSSKGVDIHLDDVFSFNHTFTHKLNRIKINQVQLKETQEENQATNEKVFQDRQYQVDAAIVRIMKMRKSLQHNLLVSEVVGQLKFSIKPADIKKRIESLIERDYLARDEQNPNQYNYLA